LKVVLTIAGSDCSAGAGIQADLKTFEAFGVFGCSVITVLTSQNTKGVTNIQEISPSFIKDQIDAVLDDFDVACIKIGMLFSNDIIDVVRDSIKDLNIPIVFDPVFISKAGSKLLNEDAIENLKTLFPYSKVTTPNLYEAKELFGNDALKKISKVPCEILIKNHTEQIDNKKVSIDTLFYKNGEKKIFQSDFIDTSNTHGTGCSFSSAITANLALGKTLEESIRISKEFIFYAIKNAPNLGSGKGPIAHKLAGEIISI
jgi:hydroxymethylpyrimidine/phosphomethylpyrimidine kinase